MYSKTFFLSLLLLLLLLSLSLLSPSSSSSSSSLSSPSSSSSWHYFSTITKRFCVLYFHSSAPFYFVGSPGSARDASALTLSPLMDPYYEDVIFKFHRLPRVSKPLLTFIACDLCPLLTWPCGVGQWVGVVVVRSWVKWRLRWRVRFLWSLGVVECGV